MLTVVQARQFYNVCRYLIGEQVRDALCNALENNNARISGSDMENMYSFVTGDDTLCDMLLDPDNWKYGLYNQYRTRRGDQYYIEAYFNNGE